METTITDRKVHGSMKPSKGSEAVKEEKSKKLSEAVWSFPLPSVQFACAQHSPSKLCLCIRCRQTVFVSFLSLFGAESVLFLCSHKEKNQKKVRSAAGEKNPFHYASQRRADAIVASSFRRCHAMEDGFIFKTPRGGWRHSHAHGV